MRTLLDERFAPITSQVGFLELPLHQVAEGLTGWRRSLGRDVQVQRPTEGFPAMLHRLEPLTGGTPQRELLLDAGRWTAYFDNFINGSDPEGPIAYLSRTLGCQGVVIRNRPHIVDHGASGKTRSGSVQFLLFGPHRTDFINYVRSIAAAYDGHWVFVSTGTEQPFEETEAYGRRRIRDRFTSDMLERYCQAMGIDVFNPSAYGPDAVLIEDPDPLPAHIISMTLAEVQERKGIVPGMAAQAPG